MNRKLGGLPEKFKHVNLSKIIISFKDKPILHLYRKDMKKHFKKNNIVKSYEESDEFGLVNESLESEEGSIYQNSIWITKHNEMFSKTIRKLLLESKRNKFYEKVLEKVNFFLILTMISLLKVILEKQY